MSDTTTTIKQIRERIYNFMAARDWQQFHSPKNLSTRLIIEAAELVEIFNWVDDKKSFEIAQEKREAVAQEIADVLIVAFGFCNIAGIDVAEAIEKKLEINGQKYPVAKAKGNCKKYTEL